MWHAYSCDMHYLDYMTFLNLPCYFILWSHVLVIILHNSYSSRTSHVHYIYVTSCMHGLLVHNWSSQFSCCCYYFQFSILPIISYFLFQCSTRAFTIFSYSSFTVPSCTLAGLLLTDFIIFQYLDSESQYRELIVEHILVQLSSGQFSFFSWLVLFRYGG